MLISQASNLMLLHGTDDNVKHFKMLFANERFTQESLLSDYINFVIVETDVWLTAFPLSLKSLTAISKPKTALLKLLTIPSIMTDIGPQLCFDVADKISDSYRRLAKCISEERLLSSVRTRSQKNKSTPHMDSEIGICLKADADAEAEMDEPFEEEKENAQWDEETSRRQSGSCSSNTITCDAQTETTTVGKEPHLWKSTHNQNGHFQRKNTSEFDSNNVPTRPKLVGGKFAALVRVIRDLSIMLDDVLSDMDN